MKHTVWIFLATSLFLGCSKSPQAGNAANGLPEWVVGERETLVLKNPDLPAYLNVTQSATILRPRALTKAAELERLNPGLADAWPKLPELLGAAEVSPKFKTFYDAKKSAVAGGETLSARHYFDCATVLQLKDCQSGRCAVLFQSDMDVDTDGTDPVRLPRIQDYDDARMSRSFQPVLSYSWAKRPADTAESPFIRYYADTLTRLRSFEQQISAEAAQDHGYIWQGAEKYFVEQISSLEKKAKYYDEDLRERRSLVGSLDPFIVVPQTWPDRLGQPFSVQVGDFAAVIYGGKIYPCLIGDTGVESKAGEASLRLAQAINSKASGRNSAVETVGVTYVIFPKTRLAMGPPDLSILQSEVARLLGEMGGPGAGVRLHAWQ